MDTYYTIKIQLDANRSEKIPYPNGLPIPNVGDKITMRNPHGDITNTGIIMERNFIIYSVYNEVELTITLT